MNLKRELKTVRERIHFLMRMAVVISVYGVILFGLVLVLPVHILIQGNDIGITLLIAGPFVYWFLYMAFAAIRAFLLDGEFPTLWIDEAGALYDDIKYWHVSRALAAVKKRSNRRVKKSTNINDDEEHRRRMRNDPDYAKAFYELSPEDYTFEDAIEYARNYDKRS